MTEVHFYRLELSPEIEAFRGEIEYALDFVAESYPIRLDPSADRVLRYPGDLPARLFLRAVSVAEDGLRLNRAAFEALDGFWPVEGTSQGSLGYDAIGIIFFMLSRMEERDAPSYDRHGRFEPEQAASVRRGLHAQPLADRAAADIAFFLTGMHSMPMREFELIPTHDVDILKGYHRWWEPLRYAAGDLLKRRAPGSALGRFSAYGTGEPFVSFRDMMALSERFGLKSRFYMMGPSQDPMDSPYVSTMKGLLSRLSREILARGHRIGFHPGYRTLDNPAEWRRQRAGLEAVLGTTVTEGRQHVLRYCADRTPVQWDSEGMAEDFTLAYPGPCGFRNGTTHSHRAYDLVRRQVLNLRQTATAVMDFALFDTRYRALDVESAMAEALGIAVTVKTYRGRLVVLHHTGQPSGPARDFYGRFLEQLL